MFKVLRNNIPDILDSRFSFVNKMMQMAKIDYVSKKVLCFHAISNFKERIN